MKLLLAGALVSSVTAAHAQPVIGGTIDAIDDTVTGLAGDAQVIAGAGVGFTTRPYADFDGSESFVLPLVSYQSEQFEFIGKTLSAQVYEWEGLALSAVADWRFQGYDAEDSPVLDGMDDRDGTLEVGARLKTDALGAQFTATALADLLSRHGGYEISAEVSYELSGWRPLSVRPNAGVRYRSASLSDYYFGVDPEEELALANVADDGDEVFFRSAYETGDGFTPFIGVTARQALSYKVAVFGAASYEFLPSSVTDSPIIEDDGQFFGFFGVVYIFGDKLRQGDVTAR